MVGAPREVARIGFGEGPRWRDGRLWFSDFAERSIWSVSPAGDLRVEHLMDDSRPSGLGWTPDGELLFVSMDHGEVRRLASDGSSRPHADLHPLSPWPWNDMVVDRDGRAYVGEFGFDFNGAMAERGLAGVVAEHPTARLALVQADGMVEIAAEDMHFPNGSVITPDDRTLIVAETLGCRLTAFDIGADGRLSGRRTWAPLGERLPDGICLDAEGAVWFANPAAPECVRVAAGGQVLEVIDTGLPCFACMLGGDDGRDLYMLAASWTEPGGRILVARTPAPHTGRP